MNNRMFPWVQILVLVILTIAMMGCGELLPFWSDTDHGDLVLDVSGLNDAISTEQDSPRGGARGIPATEIVAAEVSADAGNFPAPLSVTVSLTNGTGVAELSGLPIGANRVVWARGLDSQGSPVPGAEIYTTVDILPGANSATLNWDTTPRGLVFSALLEHDRSSGTDYAISLQSAHVETKVLGIIQDNGLPHPSLVDASSLAAAIIADGGSIPVGNNYILGTGSVSLSITGIGTSAGWPTRVQITDPASKPVEITSDGTYTVDNVLPGTWELVLNIGNGAYEKVLTLEPVSEGAATSLASDADGSTVDLMGPWDLSGTSNVTLGFAAGSVPVQEIPVGNHVVFLPTGYEAPTAQPTGDFTGTVVRMANGEVAGFASQTPSNGAGDASGVCSDDAASVSAVTWVDSLTHIGSSSKGDTYTAHYLLDVGSLTEAIDVRNRLIELVGLSQNGGNVTGLPAPVGAAQADRFRVILTAKYSDPSEVVKTVAVTADASYTTFETDVAGFVDGTNIAQAGTVRTTTRDTYTAQGGGSLADFLFVVDNSGSMSEEQNAVSLAATSFWDKLSSSGLDFRAGLITTDSDQLVGSGFTSSRQVFETDVVVGTNGGSTETGIYFAERALGPGGTVSTAGYPRPGASLSVIVLSDEESQYESRASGAFDPSNNLFVTNGYRFYSIVDKNRAGQYDDLSTATGGSVASIANTGTGVFDEIMELIATNAGGASSVYQLSEQNAINATIRVTVDGTTVPKSSTDGWAYISASNSVVFYGASIPTGGQTVQITYDWKN